MADFVHLHLHTEYSLLDGACRVDALVKQAARLKMPAIAVTEHGNLFSSVIFHDAAKQHGVKPILGCEVYVAASDRRTRNGQPGETAHHLVLLAETNEGYRNLIKLVSSGYTEGFYYQPRIDKELLAQHAKGLIGLSGCLKGEIADSLSKDRYEQAKSAAATYRDIFGAHNFFLEMQDQGLEAQKVVNATMPKLASDVGLPMVCTNDVHYLTQEDSKPHDILLCIGTGRNVQDADRVRFHGDQFFLKTPEDMARLFGEFPEAIANTVRIAERCDVSIGGLTYHLPHFEVPGDATIDGYFEQVVREGFAQRLPRVKALIDRGVITHTIDDYEQRLTYEIQTITRMRYAAYFLIVWDFIRYARERGIPVGPGRGSAAGSAVAWCLQITDVDPIAFDLVFERFLNPDRVAMPDLDIDVCERRRGEVLEYVTRKYGREHVAQIITFGTMKAKSVVRDVARALNMPHADVDKVAKLIPAALDMTLEKALQDTPALKQLEAADPQVKELLSIGRQLEGQTRHASVHAAGVVIAPQPLTEFVPLYKGHRDEIVTQWGMKEIERVGLLKMGVLGLSTLTLLDDCVKEITRTTGKDIDLANLPIDDAKTFELFGNGQTAGVFQFDSAGMRETLRKAKPQRFDDLIALNALYRPGPLRAGVIDEFIARRHGHADVTYVVPQLAPILRETYGLLVYQEQAMRVARDLAGFTMAEGDLLRQAMAQKDAAAIKTQRERFVSGAAGRGLTDMQARQVFELLESFAGYGFNKSHATTCTRLAYQSAYLKANYPWHFMAALLSIDAQNADRLAVHLGECRDIGVPVLGPDLTRSELHFTVAPEGVRFGLAAIKHVGEGTLRSILEVRRAKGRIDSLDRLCEECDAKIVTKKVLENLIKAGACDGLYARDAAWMALPPPARRARLINGIDQAIEQAEVRKQDREQGQSFLFGGDLDGDDHLGAPMALAESAPWSDTQMLAFEKEALGLYLSTHPLARYVNSLKTVGAKTTSELVPSGEAETAVGGIITGCRIVRTRKGDQMAVFRLEDLDGSVEVVVYSEPYKQHASLIENGALVLIKGRVELDEEEQPKVRASELQRMSLLTERLARSLHVKMVAPPCGKPTFEALADLFSRHRGDRRVTFELEITNRDHPVRIHADIPQVRVRPSERLVAEVERICGAGSATIR